MASFLKTPAGQGIAGALAVCVIGAAVGIAWKVREHRESLATAPTGAALVLPARPPRTHADDATDAALRVWQAYEALPKAQQTPATLEAALTEADTHARGLDDSSARALREANQAHARKHLAAQVGDTAYATGDKFTVLVPAKDAAECAKVAPFWMQSADLLRRAGFVALHCDGLRYTSKLTGDVVQENAKDWPLQ